MMSNALRGVGLVAVVALGVCAAGCTTKTDEPAVSEWQGATPHFRISGTYKGEDLDLTIAPGDAANTAEFSCVREYQTPLVNGEQDLTHAKLYEVKLHGFVTVKGERRAFEIEFKRQNFFNTKPGGIFTVIPRNDAARPEPGQFWFEWEWHDAVTGDTLDERAAQQGSFTLGEYTGTTDANGMLPDDTGTFGGFVTAKWSESETISLSFTAKCGKNEVESDE